MQDIVTNSFERALPADAWNVVSLLDGRHLAVDEAIEIGRARACAFPIEDRAASRVHVRFEPDGTLIDLGSRNGTFVDGYRTTRAEISRASIVRVGDTVLRILRGTKASPSRAPLVGATLGAVHRTLARVAPSELPVLISGETGTGKNVVARMIHDASGRKGPFVTVNCLAGEAFDVPAEGGTLFLDEIGELAPSAQTKLLHMLETKRPARIIASTNRSLHSEFRADLHARLAGVELRLPPLRDRIEDLGLLIRYLWERTHTRSVAVTANALEALALHPWPHNVRELEHVLRAASLVDRDTLDLDALPEPISARLLDARRASEVVPRVVHADRRSEIEAVLRDNRGNVRRAAHALGIARGHLYRLLARWDVDPGSFRG